MASTADAYVYMLSMTVMLLQLRNFNFQFVTRRKLNQV